MSTGFFSFDEDKLIDVSQMAFESEDALQELVAQYPQLLSGDEGSAAGMKMIDGLDLEKPGCWHTPDSRI